MDAAAIFTMARELSHTNDIDYPDTRLLPFLNVVKDDLFSYMITWLNENQEWDTWEATTVANQSEYVIPEAASDTAWNLKISVVSVNYDGETHNDWRMKYVKAKQVKLWNLAENWNYYINNQSNHEPIFYIADNSIFLAPAPSSSEAWATRLELKWIRSIIDYATDTTEADIKIPLYLHSVLVQWVLPYIHKSEWVKSEASLEQAEYEKQRDLAVKKFTDRYEWPYYMSYPEYTDDTTYLVNLD